MYPLNDSVNGFFILIYFSCKWSQYFLVTRIDLTTYTFMAFAQEWKNSCKFPWNFFVIHFLYHLLKLSSKYEIHSIYITHTGTIIPQIKLIGYKFYVNRQWTGSIQFGFKSINVWEKETINCWNKIMNIYVQAFTNFQIVNIQQKWHYLFG